MLVEVTAYAETRGSLRELRRRSLICGRYAVLIGFTAAWAILPVLPATKVKDQDYAVCSQQHSFHVPIGFVGLCKCDFRQWLH